MMQDLARCIQRRFVIFGRWEGSISFVRKLFRLEGKRDKADAISILLRILSHVYYLQPSENSAQKRICAAAALISTGESEQK